ncbi:hypothetical protein QYE76_048831 [Lolium multiflorum]|uniref:Ubiquitin-like protease family profile domain-containing protein n=1 Tax=Lolium multiflorum TaxID=4521 RepID=A0AAD8SLT5_LOLMU|nr:hypothetical protein QYE76_048831 [Lolium multiflorum]
MQLPRISSYPLLSRVVAFVAGRSTTRDKGGLSAWFDPRQKGVAYKTRRASRTRDTGGQETLERAGCRSRRPRRPRTPPLPPLSLLRRRRALRARSGALRAAPRPAAAPRRRSGAARHRLGLLSGASTAASASGATTASAEPMDPFEFHRDLEQEDIVEDIIHDGDGEDRGSGDGEDRGSGDGEAECSGDGEAECSGEGEASEDKLEKQGPAKKLTKKDHFTIEAISPKGKPVAPQTVATKFKNQCGVLVIDRIPITIKEWNKTKKVSESEVADRYKDSLFDDLMAHFSLPQLRSETEMEKQRALVKKWALQKMGELFRAWKNRLWATYKAEKKPPLFEGYLSKQEHNWEEFVKYKSSDDAVALSKKNKKNASEKLYHHHTGRGGYEVACLSGMHKRLMQRNGITPEPIRERWDIRAQNWFLGHGCEYDMKTGDLVESDSKKREIQQQQREINELKGQREPDNTADTTQRRGSSVADSEAPPTRMAVLATPWMESRSKHLVISMRLKISECRSNKMFNIGFVDPDKVHQGTVRDNGRNGNLLSFHWILLDIQVDKGVVEVRDPLSRGLEGFTDLQRLLQRVWRVFKKNFKDSNFAEKLTFTPVPCAQPQGTNLCGYYVCEFIRMLTTEKHNDNRFNVDFMREKLQPHEHLQGITEEVAELLMREVIDDNGLFSPNRRIK